MDTRQERERDREGEKEKEREGERETKLYSFRCFLCLNSSLLSTITSIWWCASWSESHSDLSWSPIRSLQMFRLLEYEQRYFSSLSVSLSLSHSLSLTLSWMYHYLGLFLLPLLCCDYASVLCSYRSLFWCGCGEEQTSGCSLLSGEHSLGSRKTPHIHPRSQVLL